MHFSKDEDEDTNLSQGQTIAIGKITKLITAEDEAGAA